MTVIKNTSTDEGREFWAHVDSVAQQVRSIPEATTQQPKPTGNGEDVTAIAKRDVIATSGVIDPSTDPYTNLIMLAVNLRQKFDPITDPYIGVANDLEARSAMGLAKYGSILRTNNGRDALMDLFQEILDACAYYCQARLEGLL